VYLHIVFESLFSLTKLLNMVMVKNFEVVDTNAEQLSRII
jgi:hypothetical protein